MGNTSIYLTDDLEEDLEEVCPDHMSRSAWIQQAIREKINRENRITELESRVETLEEQQQKGPFASAISSVSGAFGSKKENERYD